MFPLNKYRYYKHNSTIYAVSTYAGKTVKGKAICHPNDNYSEQMGKELAAARCNQKIAYKRCDRAAKKVAEAERMLEDAQYHLDKMYKYYNDSIGHLQEANEYCNSVRATIEQTQQKGNLIDFL